MSWNTAGRTCISWPLFYLSSSASHPARRLPGRHRGIEPRDESPAGQLAQCLPLHADLLGILLGIRLTKDILNLPDFVQHILSYHYHSVVIITVTFFCAHTVSSFLKDKLSKSGDKAATTSILTTGRRFVRLL